MYARLISATLLENQQYTDEDYIITEYKKNPVNGGEEQGVVVKKQGDPLRKTADGKVLLYAVPKE